MQVLSRRTAFATSLIFAFSFSSAAAFAAAAAPAKPAMNHPSSMSEKDKLSYAIGMQMAASLEQVKGEINIHVLTQAVETSVSGGKTALTVPEAQATLQAFGKKMQARQVAAESAAGGKNQTEGAAFLAANAKKPGVKTTASGLQYQVIKAANGPKPKATDSVKVNYTGSLLNGSVFDSSAKNGGPIVFKVDQVIPGWTEGLQLMNVGSKYVFWIPGKLAYGAKGTPGGPIGPNAMLKFEVELVSIGAK